MASSEHQGVQVALIIFVIITVVLSVTTYLFFSSYDKASAEADRQRTAAADANNVARQTQDENNELKAMMGFKPAAPLEDIKLVFAEDMANYASTFPAETQYYRFALAESAGGFQKTKELLASKQEELTNLQQINEAREQAKQMQIQQFAQAAEAAGQQLAAESAKFNETATQLARTSDGLQQQVQAQQADLTTVKQESEAQLFQLNARLTNTDNLFKQQKQLNDELTDPDFEVADGEIRWVNQRFGTAWINLGSADHLRTQLTFSVHPADALGVARRERKGTVEVTEILGEHLAEVRIVDESRVEPMMRGDKIYTPLWHPGRRVHFAVAGFIDLDDDRTSDRDVIKNLILMSGGAIDAEVADDGARTGQLSVDTRYLILGKEPVLAKDPTQAASVLQAYSDLRQQAEELGVEVITVEKFLDYVGWSDPNRLLNFGRGAKSEDFLRDAPDGGFPVSRGKTSRYVEPGMRDGGLPVSRGATSELFRRRDPRAADAPAPVKSGATP